MDERLSTERVFDWVPAVVFAAFVYWMSVKRFTGGPAGGGINPLLKHVGVYALLAGLAFYGYRFSDDRVVHAALLSAGFGALIEVNQYFLSHRFFGYADIAANAAGAATLLLLHKDIRNLF